jgi:hypothetical protein
MRVPHGRNGRGVSFVDVRKARSAQCDLVMIVLGYLLQWWSLVRGPLGVKKYGKVSRVSVNFGVCECLCAGLTSAINRFVFQE